MRGFTLLEIAIVLMVIGLLAGGIAAGSSMMDAARVRRAIEEVDLYKKSIDNFKTMYESYPGDFPRATDIWGIADGLTGSDATCYLKDSSTLADTRATCNGNGDGYIDKVIPGGPAATWEYSERFRAWQHLANAKMIGGSYTGIHDGLLSSDGTGGVNVPRAAVGESAAYHFLGLDHDGQPVTLNTCYFDGYYNINTLVMISSYTLDFSPNELAKLDAKVDDGEPGFGKVFNLKSTCPTQVGCTTSNDPVTARYAASDRKICGILYFKL